MTKIIVIGGGKGGVAKSSLAQTFASYLVLKNEKVLLIDADPQKTTLDWVKERRNNPDLPNIPCIHAIGDLTEDLVEQSKNYEWIIVDPCGVDPNNPDSKEVRSALALATKHLNPLRPKRRDVKTLRQISSIVEVSKMVNPKLESRSVITQCPSLPSQGYRIEQAKEACESFGIKALNSITRSRNSYDDCDEDGYSVIEYTDNKAREEAIGLIEEFLGD